MLRWVVAFVLAGACLDAHAAMKSPIHWRVKVAPAKAVKAGEKFSVTITGEPDAGWHLYALEEPEGGPIATDIGLTEGDPADLLHVEEGKPKMLPDPVTGKQAGFFDGAADFVLRLQADKDAAASKAGLHVLVRYQSCNDRMCLPPH